MDTHADHPLGHVHNPDVNAGNARRVGMAALLTGAFMVAEVAGGIVSGSLALLADAGHMLTDFGALALAWFAFRLSRRPADWRRTYGFDRFSVLVAFVNGLTLFGIAALIVWEAAKRLGDPPQVAGGIMLVVALAGLAVNLIAFRLLSGGDRQNINMRGALAHVIGDLLGSFAAILAAVIILVTGWVYADPLLSVLVAVIIVRSAYGVVRDAAHILLEGAPRGLSGEVIANDLTAAVPGLRSVHHVHVWSITEARPVVTLEAATDGSDAAAIKAAIKARLHARFGIDHATVEIETAGDPPSGPACC